MLTRQFLTVKEVAGLLKVGEVTVRHWIKGGELRAIDVGREWRIAPNDLEQFLLRHATTVRISEETQQEAGGNLPMEQRKASPNEVENTRVGKSRTD